MKELFKSEFPAEPGRYWAESKSHIQMVICLSPHDSPDWKTTFLESWKVGPKIPTPEECDLFEFWKKNTTQLEVFKHSRGDVCAQMKFDCTVRGFGVDGFSAIQDLRKKWKEISGNDASSRAKAETPAAN